MNRRKNDLPVCALLMAIATAFAQTSAPSGATREAREIRLTAKKYEFSPSTLAVKKGERVKLVITALDRDHGFKLDAFGINQKLTKGDPATVEFTADKAGTFPFKCSDFCGLGHPKMKGRLKVSEE